MEDLGVEELYNKVVSDEFKESLRLWKLRDKNRKRILREKNKCINKQKSETKKILNETQSYYKYLKSLYDKECSSNNITGKGKYDIQIIFY